MKKIYASLSICSVLTCLSGCAYAPHNNLSAERVSASSIHHTSSLEHETSIEEITNKLPGHFYLKGITFQNAQKPYYLAINYTAIDNQHTFEKSWTSVKTKRTLLHNATILLSVVQNVDSVHFTINTTVPQTITITRKELTDFYGIDLRNYNDVNQVWKAKYEGQQEKIDEFYDAHPITEMQ
ncbi:DUF4825 domain-containing protein [Priestia aryabhattai]|uniref:DUF4825 domain-containing protein n=1 Tax=Priestia aryabhattai TaxID=412384 RepID=UPI0020413685|nr:DUF4825 domain-containing protein [Priestia aryabhattai]MCM3772700.1 DUF4825 domain-containing protein [Priestia aryabhattai]